jgi:HAD superfamily hydrolase (TIGR01509 family)
MNIIIPLCGIGKRFSDNGYKNPKPLIKVLDKEIISYTLDNLNIKNDDKIYIIYHESLDNFGFTNFINTKYNIQLIKVDYYTKGAVETISLGLPYILNTEREKYPCLLLDGDTFYIRDILFDARNAPNNSVFYFKENTNNDKPKFSYIKMNENNVIVDIIEKQKISNNANTGAYLFKDIHLLFKYANHIIDKDIRFNNEYYTSCIIKAMIDDGHVFNGICIDLNAYVSLGTPEQVEHFIYMQNLCYLFDLDGTLVLTDHIYKIVWKEILNEYHINVTDDIYNNYIYGNDDSVVLKRLLSNCNDYTSVSNKKNELFKKYIHQIHIIENAVDYIKYLYKLGRKICIVTNCNRDTAINILNYIQINDCIHSLVIGNECKNPKPYPDPYKYALETIQCVAENAIVFEDSSAGLLSAKGILPKYIIGVETTLSKEELINRGANYTIKDYKNLELCNIKDDDKMLINIENKIFKVLSKNYNVDNVHINRTKLKGGYIANVMKVNTNNFDCIIKLENKEESVLQSMAVDIDLYGREYYFYETISNIIDDSIIRVPKCYGIIKDENFKSEGIILQNLDTDEFTLNLNLNKQPVQTSLNIINSLAVFHSKFWNKNLQAAFPLLKKNNDTQFNPKWNNFINNKWGQFYIKWKTMLTPSQLELGQKIVDKFQIIQDKLSNNNLTLCHGDVKSGNIFYKKDTTTNSYLPYFIDWQYIINGKGVQDLVFFIIESFNKETINKYSVLFKHYYYIQLLENGILNYSFKEYEHDFNLSICYYPFFVAIWFGTTPDEDLIDVNFPFFFIQKLFYFIETNININFLDSI